jgi:predicted ATPase
LNEAEQAVLRNLAIFKGFFDLDAAREIARCGLPDPSQDLHIIDSLVAKSLLSFETGEGISGYRLHNSTRAYGLEKLQQRGEFETIAAMARGSAFLAMPGASRRDY